MRAAHDVRAAGALRPRRGLAARIETRLDGAAESDRDIDAVIHIREAEMAVASGAEWLRQHGKSVAGLAAS